MEGCGAGSAREFARFLTIAIRSANELEHHLLVAKDREQLLPDDWLRFTAETVEIRRMICGYRRKVLDNAAVAEE